MNEWSNKFRIQKKFGPGSGGDRVRTRFEFEKKNRIRNEWMVKSIQRMSFGSERKRNQNEWMVESIPRISFEFEKKLEPKRMDG